MTLSFGIDYKGLELYFAFWIVYLFAETCTNFIFIVLPLYRIGIDRLYCYSMGKKVYKIDVVLVYYSVILINRMMQGE